MKFKKQHNSFWDNQDIDFELSKTTEGIIGFLTMISFIGGFIWFATSVLGA